MYYYPSMIDANGRTWNAYHALACVFVDGAVRQHRAHADIVSAFYTTKLDSLRTLSEARDMPQLAAGLLSCAAPEPGRLAHLSAQLAEIAVDMQHKVAEVLGSHAAEGRRLLAVATERAAQKKPRGENGRPSRRRTAAA